MTPFIGFLPVLTFRFPLDELLAPYVEAYAPGVLISVTEFLAAPDAPRPGVPLLLDSGGANALDPAAQVVDEGWCGVLVTASGHRVHPLDVLDTARTTRAAGQCTLDFPCPDRLGTAEQERRWALGERNAAYALRQARTGLMYASVQPGQPLDAILSHHPDGVALGGLVPHAHDRARLAHEVRQVRAQIGSRPLHVFGVGHPDSIRAVTEAGATSVDSSSPQRTAAAGRSWAGDRVDDPSPPERLRLAVSNLLSALDAPLPLQAFPLWRAL